MRPPPGLRRSAPHKLSARTPAHLDPRIASALAAPLPTAVDRSLPPPMDQGQTSSCSAHALVKAIEIVTGYRGSPRDLYYSAGLLEGDTSDDGRELVDCLTAVANSGIAPFAGPTPDGRNSDVTPENVQHVPTPQDYSHRRQVDLGRASIDPRGDHVSDLCAATLAAGGVIYLGTQIGHAFEELQGAVVAQPDPANDPSGGGHALAGVGYRTMPDGSRQWRVENSWGEAFDEAGECWASTAWLAACWELHPVLAHWSDALAPDPSPAGERGAGLLDAVLVAVDRAIVAGEHDVQAVVDAILARPR